MIYSGWKYPVPTDYAIYYPFNTNVIDTVSSITLSSNTISTTIKKVGAGSLDFTSSASYNNSATTSLAFLTSISAITITHWLYINSYSTSVEYNTYWNIYNTSGFGFYLCSGLSAAGNLSLYITLNSGQGFYFTKISGILVPLTTWTHIAYVFTNNGANVSIYLNGSSVISNTTISNPPFNGASTYNAIGFGTQTGTDFRATGLIDDFRVYNRALTTNEITSIYNYTG
jgi:hypothetical protein